MAIRGEPKTVFHVYRLVGDLAVIRQTLNYRGYAERPSARNGFLLFTNESSRAPKWLPLLRQLSQATIELANQTASFVLLRTSDSSGDIYAVTGGQGYFGILPFLDHEFGLEAASRLIAPDRIKGIRSRAFTGNVDQEEAYYRGYYSPYADPLNWVKLTKSVLGELRSADLSEKLGLKREDTRRIRLEGKAGFAIRRSMTLDELDTVFARLDSLMAMEPRIPIMRGCTELQGQDKGRLDAYLLERLTQAYTQFTQGSLTTELDAIALSHDDLRQLLACDQFSISQGRLEDALEDLDMASVFQVFRGWDLSVMPHPSSVRIEGRDADGVPQVEGNLKQFVEAEIRQDNQTFLAVGKRWFQVTDDFVRRLNERLVPFLEEGLDVSLPDWGWEGGRLETEDAYVARVASGADNVYELHRNKIDNQIEVADLLVIHGSTRYLVYVKRGLGSDLRVLARQAYESVGLLANDAAFRAKAIDIMREVGYEPGDDFDVRDCRVVLAVVDRRVDRGDRPLLARATTLAKMELAATLEYFRASGMPTSIVHEIPIAAE